MKASGVWKGLMVLEDSDMDWLYVLWTYQGLLKLIIPLFIAFSMQISQMLMLQYTVCQ